jgi:hypothetical protein
MRTESPLRQWAQTRRPRARATSMAAPTSASDIGVSSDDQAEVPRSPERFSLSRSTPSRASSRQTRRMASGPSATQQKVGVSW